MLVKEVILSAGSQGVCANYCSYLECKKGGVEMGFAEITERGNACILNC